MEIQKIRENLSKNIEDKDEIINIDSYSQASVSIPLLEHNDKFYILFQRRSSHIRQANEVCLPGGIIERDKDKHSLNTALREFYEELSIPGNKLENLGKLGKLVLQTGMLIHVYVINLNLENIEEIKIDPNEVSEIFYINLNFFKNNRPEKYKALMKMHSTYIDENKNEVVLFPAKSLGLPQKYWSSWGTRTYNIPVYQTEYGNIWGITAQIIDYFIQKIYG